eukprot:4573936-Pleurochrysis_carterae.AAC.1
MRFEAFNQVVKRIVQGSNYKNICMRVLSLWSMKCAKLLLIERNVDVPRSTFPKHISCGMKSARNLARGKVAEWGITRCNYAIDEPAA